MKKKIDILGRKVPILAVMMALLVIGTASAALISNYATLTGDVTVTNPITVNGGIETITFTEGVATFNIANSGTEPVLVNLDTKLYFNVVNPVPGDELINTEGTTIEYNTVEAIDVVGVAPDDVYDGNYVSVPLTVPVGGIDVIVTFDADPALEVGTYTIQVAVNPV